MSLDIWTTEDTESLSALLDEAAVEIVPGAAPTTVLPRRVDSSMAPQQRRSIGGVSRHDLKTLGGAAISALCTTMLLFGRLTALSGDLGFVVVGFLVFLVTYGVLVSLTEDRPAVVDKVVTAMLASAGLVALGALASVVLFTVARGWHALFAPNTYTSDLSTSGPLDGLDKGGISHAIVGTLIITGMALVITVPLGVACAVYLNERHTRIAGLVRTVVTAMTALPSILAGLLIFSTWILILGFERSGLAAIPFS